MGDLPLLGAETQDVLLPGTRSTALPVSALRAQRERGLIGLLVLLDASMAAGGFALAYVLRYVLQLGRAVLDRNQQPLWVFVPTMLLLVAATILALTFKGMYRLPRNSGWLTQLGTISSSVTISLAVTIVVTSFVYRSDFYSRLIFPFAFITMIGLIGLARFVLNFARHWRWSHGQDLERVLVVGGMGLARQVMANLQDRPTLGYDLVGYVADQTPASIDQTDVETPIAEHLGGLEALPVEVARRKVERVIVALPFWENHRLPTLVEICHQLGVPFQVVPDFYELSFDRVTIQEVRGVPLIDLRENVIKGTNYALKRAIDVALVLLTMPVWGLISLVIMLLIRLDSPGAMIFRQTRIGRNGRPFEFLKFRTMVVNAEQLKQSLMAQNESDGPLFKMKKDPRITRVGGFLRRTSLDELPQLWNVLRGEMSLVGPRPAVPEEVAQYEPWQRRRLEVTPGCTGLWQATGRSNTTFEEMVRLDIYYAEHWSLGLDLRILLLTVPAVLSARGAY